VTWDFGRDYPNVKLEGLVFTVSVAPLAATEQPLYMVVDLSAGATAASWPVRYTSVGPAHVQGARDEACQTTELWLRRINPPKTAVLHGASLATSSSAYYVKQTKDYYMGIFELTEKQYERITGNWNARAYFTNTTCRASRPYHNIESGYFSGTGYNSVAHPEKISATSPLGKLYAKTGLRFTLPTVAQVEYAARGGRISETVSYTRYSVNGAEASATTIMRYSGNSGKYNGESDDTVGLAAVGSYAPNAFGLYDMIGNAREHTCENANGWQQYALSSILSQYRTTAGDDTLGKTKDNPLVDPIGPWPDKNGSAYTYSFESGYQSGTTSLFNLNCPEATIYKDIKHYGGRVVVIIQ